MAKPELKSQIRREQLIWFLATLLNEREICELLMHTDLITDPDRLYSCSKQQLLGSLTNAFFRQSRIDAVVTEHLSQKAEAAIERVGYMVVEEIHKFFRSPDVLIESGEFGEVVWALIADPREAVYAHGYHLLTTAYGAHNASSVAVSPPPEAVPIETHAVQPIEAAVEKIRTKYEQDLETHRVKIAERDGEIERLERTLTHLKGQSTVVEKRNKRLEQHCQFLVEENEALKAKENTYQESEKRINTLQQENLQLQEKAAQDAKANERLGQLESEHQELLAEKERLTAQFQEVEQIKAVKETFTVELKLVEEAVYKEYQALDQLKTDLLGHFDIVEKSYEASRTALNQIRQTVNTLDEPQFTQVEDNVDTLAQPRVGVFVDVQNMFYAAKDRFERRVDYIKLLDLIVGPRQLIAAYAYIVQIPEIDQSNFFSLLEHNGYTIRSKDLRLRGDGSAKGDWDVGIAVDVVSMLGTLDVVILASGDGDFCPLAELIKQQHKRIEVVAFEHNTSMDLQAVADQFFPIGEELLM